MLVARFKRENETEKERGLVWPRWLSAKRQKIETVFSQLVSRFNMKKVRTKDAWHFSSRFLRKVLSHTMAVVFCRREELSPTRFSGNSSPTKLAHGVSQHFSMLKC